MSRFEGRKERHVLALVRTFTICLFLVTVGLHAQVTPVLFAEGFTKPLSITHAGDDRLFVVEQGGLIKILNSDGTIEPTPFLDISGSISTGGNEQGLLGLAFHPDYTENGFFFINYTDTDGNTVIARYGVSDSNPDVANAESEAIILAIEQPYSNHNGGDLKFGADGYLYIGTGDGGSGGDPDNNAQDLSSLLGKMLRIDVDGEAPYSIPSDNPYVGDAEAAGEIWASGLRNPWRFSFDKETNDLWIADVGQNEVEEVNYVASGTPSGLNFGWRCYEGELEFNTTGCEAEANYTFPAVQYTHAGENGCSVTGGYVYRGTAYPSMEGSYFFSDYCNDRIYSLRDNAGEWQMEVHGQYTGNNFSTFGEDQNGELYVAGLGSGKIFRITYEGDQTGTGNQDATRWVIYPNPAGDYIYIGRQNTDRVPERISILNTSGQLLREQKIDDSNNKVNIGSLNPGIYIIEIATSEGSNHQILVKE